MNDHIIARLFRKGSNRPSKAFWRLEETNYLSSAASVARRPGACLIADCGRPATIAGLCVRCDAKYRPVCACGKKITEAYMDRGQCARCYRKGEGREAHANNRNRNARERRARRKK